MNEGLKDALLGTLMGLSFLTPAKAKETADSLISKVPASQITAVAKDIKNADNEEELNDIIKSYTSGVSDIKRVDVPKPAGYRTLSLEQRQDWNKYLAYLRDKGLAGSPKLDVGDPETQGMKELKAYLAANPGSSLNSFKNPVDLVKSIQYEMNLLRKGKEFPGLAFQELAAMQTLLFKDREKFMTLNTSKEDGNPGQYTTQENYPMFGGSVDYASASVKKSIQNTLKMIHKITKW